MTDDAAEQNLPQSQEQADNGSTAATMSPVRKPAPPTRKPEHLPPYRVLLHNDDKNTFEHVIRSVMRLTTLVEKEAELKALEAHDSDVSLLLITHRERAELYQEQFASLSITVTIEPAE